MDFNSSFAPGESPFHVKGVAYRGHLAYVQEHLPGGIRSMNAALPTQTLRDFFAQRFLAGSWYDVFPLVGAGTICARLDGVPVNTFLQKRSDHQVRQDLNGVYQFLARFVSRGLLVRGVSDGLSRYFDFLDVETESLDRGAMRTRIRGVPGAMADWFRVSAVAYVNSAFVVGGRTPPHARAKVGLWKGTEHNTPLVEVVLELQEVRT